MSRFIKKTKLSCREKEYDAHIRIVACYDSYNDYISKYSKDKSYEATKLDPKWQQVLIDKDHKWTRKEIRDHYVKHADKILKEIKGKPVMIYVNTGKTNKNVLRRHLKNDKPIIINNKDELMKLVDGRLLSIHRVFGSETNLGFVDLDIHGDFSQKETLKYAREMASKIKSKYKTTPTIYDSGGSGYHIEFELKNKKNTNTLRNELRELSEDLNEKYAGFTTGIVKGSGVRTDVTTLKNKGNIRVPYTLHELTGGVKKPINSKVASKNLLSKRAEVSTLYGIGEDLKQKLLELPGEKQYDESEHRVIGDIDIGEDITLHWVFLFSTSAPDFYKGKVSNLYSTHVIAISNELDEPIRLFYSSGSDPYTIYNDLKEYLYSNKLLEDVSEVIDILYPDPSNVIQFPQKEAKLSKRSDEILPITGISDKIIRELRNLPGEIKISSVSPIDAVSGKILIRENPNLEAHWQFVSNRLSPDKPPNEHFFVSIRVVTDSFYHDTLNYAYASSPYEALNALKGFLLDIGNKAYNKSKEKHPELFDEEAEIIPFPKKSYKISKREWSDKLPGGLADKKKPEDFDQKQLEKGIKVELEHVDNKELAKEIAMDHLMENAKYYDMLEEVEKHSSLALSKRMVKAKSPLSKYKKKRDFDEGDKTPEPKDEVYVGKNKHRFVIQDHKATKHHWDLRLENDDGVLESWAIPKAKLPEKNEKLLAVKTENHPIKYMNFGRDKVEEIPKGEYGAGKVKVVSKSKTYDPVKWTKDTIKFEIPEGKFTLHHTKGKDWLIMRSKQK